MVSDPSQMNAGELAFVGDAVFSLYARREIALSGGKKTSELHPASVDIVCCEAQAKGIDRIFDSLTPEEQAVYTKGRNMHHGSYPRHCSKGDYCKATGLEALFGWLYLAGKLERTEALYEQIRQSETAPKNQA